ncbi:MAG: hypothetical protein KBF54_02655 [Rhizobiales bacterium]|nr:hypothetical protein [Hyphomicrobiales bacterium]MBP9173429.1 hypothetical protein [Hyphomicrobiales bacterium]
MDWDHAIKRNSEVLAGIVETLFVMLGLVGEATVSRISWPAYRAVLRVLRPAESCLRRLIVVAARGLVIAPTVSRPKLAGAVKPGKRGISRPSFQLFDPQPRIVFPRRRISKRAVPRIHFFNTDGEFITIGPPIRPAKASTPARAKSADGMVNAARVIRRLEALDAALADLPRQAKRLVRWRMREEKSENPSFKTPLRPGRPPGSRRRDVHQVDELLSECQWLAWEAMKPDTS